MDQNLMVDRNKKCLDWLSVRQSGWGWRGGSMVKSSYCFCRVPKFGS